MSSQTSLILARILDTATGLGASDIHISPGSRPLMRKAGELELILDEEVATPDFIKDIANEVLDRDSRETLETKRDVIKTYTREGGRLKFHFYYQKNTPSLSIRPISASIIPFDQLNIPGEITSWFKLTSGIVLIAGSYGSGRSTVVSSIIEHINQTETRRIVTLEDPIEVIFTNQKSLIEQRAVGSDVESWKSGLKSCIDEDVDLVLVSSIEGEGVATRVVELANSGHMVAAVVTSSDTVSAVSQFTSRIAHEGVLDINSFIANVIGILGVRLLPQIGGGQILAHEILKLTQPAVAAIERANWASLRSTIALSRSEGMVSFDWSLAELVKTNRVTEEDAVTHATNPDELKRLIRR